MTIGTQQAARKPTPKAFTGLELVPIAIHLAMLLAEKIKNKKDQKAWQLHIERALGRGDADVCPICMPPKKVVRTVGVLKECAVGHRW